MTWPEVVLAALNMIQFVALTWIGSRQQQVKRDLSRANGHIDALLAEIAGNVDQLVDAPRVRRSEPI